MATNVFDQDRKRWKKSNFGLFCGCKSETAQGPFQWRFQFQNEKNNSNFRTFEKKSFLDENESKCYPISLFSFFSRRLQKIKRGHADET